MPGVIVICNRNINDYNCSSNSNKWNRRQCNGNSNCNRAITLLLQLNIQSHHNSISLNIIRPVF